MDENNNEMEELKRKLEEEEDKKENRKIILLLILLLLLFLLIILWIRFIKRPTATLGEKEENLNFIETPSPENTPVSIPTPIVNETNKPNITIINNNITTIIQSKPTPLPTTAPTTMPSEKPIEINKEFIVSNKNKQWTENLSIFNNEKYNGNPIIYPGIENTYYFEFTNGKDFDIECSIKFEEINKDNIPIKYKLKENGKYIKGDKNTYVNCNELDTDNILVNKNSQNIYELEWKWEESSNDNIYGDTNKTIKYNLQITVEAKEIP